MTMIPPEPFEDVRRARDQYAQERDVLAEALANVLAVADQWAMGNAEQRDAAHWLRVVVAEPLKVAGADVAARLEAYGHLARLRAEIEAAQREAERLHEPIRPLRMGPTVAQAAREIAENLAKTNAKVNAGVWSRFADLLEGK